MSTYVPDPGDLDGSSSRACAAAEVTWRVAERCDGGQCVEIGFGHQAVMIRDSADRDGPRITLSQEKWREFLAGVTDVT
jgi:Domain of unknown function (DUF397)